MHIRDVSLRAAIIGAAALLLAACGGGDGGETLPAMTPLPTLEAGVIPDELDALLNEIGVVPESRADVAFFVDEDSGPLYGIDEERSGLEAPFLDLRGYFALSIDVSTEAAAALDGPFACGGPEGGRVVVCSQPEEHFPEGELVVIGGLLAGDFPLDDTDHSYDIGGFFLDDEPAQTGIPSGEFDLSFLFDANRWYELHWFPAEEAWRLDVNSVVGQAQYPVESNERVLIDGSLFAFFVTEGAPLFQVRALGTDEERTFADEVSGGDVSGPDVQNAMNPLPSEPITVEPEGASGGS